MDYLLTNEGAALMTQAVSGKNLIFTRAEAGTGYSSSPAMLTQVIGSLQTLDMSVTHEGSDVRITCFLTNRELEQGYTLKQLGIYARLAETEADTLVVIGQQYSGEMIHPFADGEAEYEFVILMKASGTSSITVESGAGSLVTKRELNAHVNRMDNPHGVTKKDIGLDKVPNLTVDDMAPSFMEAEKRENVRSGEKSTILWGKVRKWLSDLKSGAFAIIANNCTTTEEGTVLDGRQGKALQDQIVELREADSEINSKLYTLDFSNKVSLISKPTTYIPPRNGYIWVFFFNKNVDTRIWIRQGGISVHPISLANCSVAIYTPVNGGSTVAFEYETYTDFKMYFIPYM